MNIRNSLLAATTAAFLVAGCGAKNTTANGAAGNGAAPGGTVVAQGGGATVTKSGDNTTTVTTNAGTMTATTGTPSSMPGGLPAYPGAQGAQGGQVSGSMGGASGVTFTTSDDAAKVLDFYANAASQAGMQTMARTNAGGTAALVLMKGSETISVSASAAGGSTQVTIGSASR